MSVTSSPYLHSTVQHNPDRPRRVGIIHIDEVDKLARRGSSDGFATWGGGRDVGGEGVQQAFLRLLEGSSVTISAKPPPMSTSTSGGGGVGVGGSSGGPSKGDPFGESWDGGSLKGGLGGGGAGVGPKKGVREGLPGFGGGGGAGQSSTSDGSLWAW